MPNEQIGARPLISEHTVDTHIRNILNKLGFNSRTQIAVWMASADR
ncbi:MAG TPA: helix-turn-helix transcriptional regulator [Actinophytocola sp.]|nr:helix-turn-helix transcriptional regulator [Actinophytocola sp.]HEV2784173.1 helix-turn-helix transcriptional regulator [Actinophytocola sp.]